MKISVIIPAAGAGKRFSAEGGSVSGGAAAAGAVSKIEQDLAGRPVFLRSIELFLRRPVVGQIILAVPPERVEEFKFRWGEKLAFHAVKMVAGGRKERWETVQLALSAVAPDSTHVAIHDAARPLTSSGLIDRVFEAAERFPAVIPALPVSHTLKRVAPLDVAPVADPLAGILGADAPAQKPLRKVVGTQPRNDLVEVQTPQVFEVGLLRRAYAQIEQGKVDPAIITDDAGLVEALGQTVVVVEGESTNLKITRPEDAQLAAAFAGMHQKNEAASLARKRLFGNEDE